MALGTLTSDLIYGLRQLRSSPGFSFVAVLTLALGIGAITAMFSAVNGVLLTALPYPDADRLVLVRVAAGNRESLPSVSAEEVVDFRERIHAFDGVASIRDNSASLTGSGEPEQIQIGGITWNFLSVLGIQPALGRDFTEDDAAPGTVAPVIISHGLWQRRFGGDPDIVGKVIQLDGTGTTVLGVMPQEAQLLLPREAGLSRDLDAWQPFNFNFRDGGRFRWMRGIARLAPGVTHAEAQAAMDNLARELIAEVPQYQQQPFTYELALLHGDLVRTVRTPLLVLFGAVGFVLLIVCANVATLLLARAARREQEIGIRSAVGASRWRIVRQLLTESLLLGVTGGAAGFALAVLGIRVLVRLAPPELPRLDAVTLDLRVFFFALVASLATVLLFGLIPALQASRTDLNETMKSGTRARGGSERARMRKVLVAVEIALSLVLLVGAGLMVRSFLVLQKTRPGFEPDNVVTFQMALQPRKYTSPEQALGFFEQVTERLEAQSGIESASGIFPLPMTGRFWTNEYAYDEATRESWGAVESDNHVVLPGYFRAMGARVLAGRTFTWADNASASRVLIVDETLARRAWPGEDPIGKRLEVGVQNGRAEMEVIGVVEHIRQDHPGERGREQTYMPVTQWPLWSLAVTVRSDRSTADVMSVARAEVRKLDADLALHKVRTMRDYIGEVVAGNRFAMLLMGLFAGIAALLAAVGLYGTIAYTVTQRRHEIGIRMALGAQPRDIFRLIVGQGLILVLGGMLAGVAASLLLTRFLSSLLYGVSPFDLPTYAAISVMLVLVALLACVVPARQATRVQPMKALHYE